MTHGLSLYLQASAVQLVDHGRDGVLLVMNGEVVGGRLCRRRGVGYGNTDACGAEHACDLLRTGVLDEMKILTAILVKTLEKARQVLQFSV